MTALVSSLISGDQLAKERPRFNKANQSPPQNTGRLREDPDAIQQVNSSGSGLIPLAAGDQWLNGVTDLHGGPLGELSENRRLLPDCANGIHIIEGSEYR